MCGMLETEVISSFSHSKSGVERTSRPSYGVVACFTDKATCLSRDLSGNSNFKYYKAVGEQACRSLVMQLSRMHSPLLRSARTPKDVAVAAAFVTYHSPSWAVRVRKHVKRACVGYQ